MNRKNNIVVVCVIVLSIVFGCFSYLNAETGDSKEKIMRNFISKGYTPWRVEKKIPALQRAQAITKILGSMRTFLNEKEYKELLNSDTIIDHSAEDRKMKVYEVLKHGLLSAFEQAAKPLGFSELIARGLAGEMWEAIEDFDFKGNYAKAVGAGFLYRGLGAVGNTLSTSIENSCKGMLDFIFIELFGNIGQTFKSLWYAIRNKLTGRSGVPFTMQQLVLQRESANKILSDLEKVAKNAGIMDARSRDKLARYVDGEQDAVDVVWQGQKTNFERQLLFWIALITKCRAYYDPIKDEAIVFYARQIEDLLEDIASNIIGPTKSHMDLGTSSIQSALTIRKNTLSLYFDNLLALIAPRSLHEKQGSDVANSKKRTRTSRFGLDDDDDFHF